jgi:STE24 endopeptidase
VHSLELTGDVPTFVAAEQRLARANLSDLDPNPFVYAFFFTHPSSPQRIALARAWQQQHR